MNSGISAIGEVVEPIDDCELGNLEWPRNADEGVGGVDDKGMLSEVWLADFLRSARAEVTSSNDAILSVLYREATKIGRRRGLSSRIVSTAGST